MVSGIIYDNVMLQPGELCRHWRRAHVWGMGGMWYMRVWEEEGVEGLCRVCVRARVCVCA